MGYKTAPDDLLTVRQIAREFHIGQKRIYALVQSGELRSLRAGQKRILIPRWVLREWIAANLSPQPLSTS